VGIGLRQLEPQNFEHSVVSIGSDLLRRSNSSVDLRRLRRMAVKHMDRALALAEETGKNRISCCDLFETLRGIH
jgi:hypothetical protein